MESLGEIRSPEGQNNKIHRSSRKGEQNWGGPLWKILGGHMVNAEQKKPTVGLVSSAQSSLAVDLEAAVDGNAFGKQDTFRPKAEIGGCSVNSSEARFLCGVGRRS